MPRSRGTTKQTRLSFAPVSSPPAGGKPSPGDGKDRWANLRYGHPSLATISKARSRKVDSRASPSPFIASKTSEENLSSIPEKPRRKSSKEKREKKVKKSKKEKKEKEGKKEKKKGKKKAESEAKLSDVENDVPQADPDSESDVPVRESARKKNKKDLKRKRSPTPNSSPPSKISNLAVSDSSDADDIITQPSRKLRRGANAQPTIVLDDSSEESEEEPVRSSPVKRRRLMRSSEAPQTPRRGQDQAELDLEEDLEDLQDSVVKETRTRGRLANSARAQRQQHLEALRRRRAGNKSPTRSDNDEESDSGSDSAESDSENEKEHVIRRPRFSYEQQDSDVESAIASDEDLDQYEEDFVLQDEDEDTMGVPTDLQGLPFEFSRHTYKQLKDYFQDAVEWMVHNQLNPAFPRDSPVYEFAFQKLEDEVKGRTGSQLVSSVWTSTFTRALLARPQMEITSYPTSDNHPCDACKRSGHPASSDIKFYGKAYSLETLEPLTDNSDEDKDESETDDDDIERDKDGHELPDENTRFYLGRHCKTKAEMAHTLTHWRFHLNEWVVEHLRCMGYLTDKQVLKRSHWKQKRREKYASEVVGKMIEDNEVKKLWRDFHITLRAARESAQ